LNLVGCVDVATHGSVVVAGQNTGTLSQKKLTNLRLHNLGFIFQSFNLIPVLNVFDNVEFPLLLKKDMTKGERRKRVLDLVDKVGLTEQLIQRPGELSGGQRQRVAIARALVTEPAIVLADEPTANLDSGTGETILSLMRTLNEQQQTTFIFSTHDHNVMNHARRLIKLVDGRIHDDGSTGITSISEEA
jgi:putative ABC transport system ATP-binding protein